MEQLIARVGYNQNVLLIEGRIVGRFCAGHLNYLSEDGFQEVDHSLAFDDAAQGWGFIKHSFHPFLPLLASGTFTFRDKFKTKDQTISYRWETAQDVKGQMIEDFNGFPAVIYADAFGEGQDLIACFDRHSLKLIVRVRDGFYDGATQIDVPVLIGKPMTGKVYRIDAADASKNYELTMEGSKELNTSKATVFGGTTPDTQTTIFDFVAYDSGDANEGTLHATPVKATFEALDALTMRLTKHLGPDFFSVAVGDVFIDPTTTYNATAGAGDVTDESVTSGQYATKRAEATGTNVNVGGSTQAYIGASNYNGLGVAAIRRVFLPIDTSGLGSGATISAATLNYYSTNGSAWSASGYAAITTQSQASSSSLATSDFGSLTLNSPPEGSSRFAPSDRTDTPAARTIALNATGLGFINKTGITYLMMRDGPWDIDNTFPPGSNYVQIDRSTGSNPPTLDVTYTTGTTYTQTVSDTLALTASYLNSTIKVIAEALTLTASYANSIARAVLDTLSFVASIDVARIAYQVVMDTISLTDSAIRSVGKVVSDTLSTADSVIRSTAHVVAETLSMTASVATVRTLIKTVIDALTLSAPTRMISAAVNGILINLLWRKRTKPTGTWTKRDIP